MNLTEPLPALSVPQRRLFWSALIVCALTRLFALSASLWDWDEVLFSSAMDEYDVSSHRPHPPGFPLFILTARAMRLVVGDNFRSLQTINVIAACLLFPALFSLCRELRFPYAVSMTAAGFCLFLPNVWFFGGTGFSDVPSLMLAVLACALLLRGCRDRWSFIGGAIVLGIAAGYRPQNLLLGALPALLACWYQLRGRHLLITLAGAALGAAILFGSYEGAARASGSRENYRQALEHHRKYILSVDSFMSPTRPSLLRLFDDFFLRPYRAGVINYLLFALNTLSLFHAIRRRYGPILLTLGIFGPFAIMAWLVLDHLSISRFSLGYIPLLAILSADGTERLATFVAHRFSWSAPRVTACVSAVILMVLTLWTVPALWTARTTDSPPAAALKWIRTHVDPRTARLYVASGMLPYAQFALSDYSMTETRDDRFLPMQTSEGSKWFLLIEGASENPAALRFLRPRRRLWKIARHRYFEVSIIPMHRAARFRDGWYESENTGGEAWRWMGRRSLTELPPVSGAARLQLLFQIPLDTLKSTPTISVIVNGALLDRFQGAEPHMQRDYLIAEGTNRVNHLVIETSDAVNPRERGLADDPRDLGLLLRSVSWGPASGEGE